MKIEGNTTHPMVNIANSVFRQGVAGEKRNYKEEKPTSISRVKTATVGEGLYHVSNQLLQIQEKEKQLQLLMSFKQAQLQYLEEGQQIYSLHPEDLWKKKLFEFIKGLSFPTTLKSSVPQSISLNDYMTELQDDIRTLNKEIQREQVKLQNIFSLDKINMDDLDTVLLKLKRSNTSSQETFDILTSRVEKLLHS